MLKIKITTIISILTCATSLLSAPRNKNQRPKSRPFRLYSQSIQAPTPPTSPLRNQFRANTDPESIQWTALSSPTLLALANAITQNTTIVPMQINQAAQQASSKPWETIVPPLICWHTTPTDQPIQALTSLQSTEPSAAFVNPIIRENTDSNLIPWTDLSLEILFTLVNATRQNVPMQTNQAAQQSQLKPWKKIVPPLICWHTTPSDQPGQTILPQDTTLSNQQVQVLENEQHTSPQITEISSAFLSVDMPPREPIPTPAREPSTQTALSRLRNYLSFF